MKFNDALKHSVEMLKSDAFKQRVIEEDKTMLKHIPILIEINKNGYLTDNSQAGRNHSGLTWDTKKPFVMKEKAYISGFMKESDATEFIKLMSIETDKNAILIPYCNGKIDLLAGLDIPLTIATVDNKTTVETHQPVAMPKDWIDFEKKQVKLDRSEKAVYIFCWDNKWGRNASGKNGLFTDVLHILKKL